MDYKVGTQVFNDWKIVREIGSGASGTVWELEKVDHEIATSSALKVVRVPQDPSLEKMLYNDGMDGISVTKFFQGVVDDLTDEIKIMNDMKGFPYIVNCEDYSVIKYPDELKWDILIRMELLTPIQAYIQSNALSEADVLKMSRELLQTLRLFESKGIIHRDIKPDNIFIDKFGNSKIGDFGIARICDKASANLSKKGTENYMAPEVFHGKEYDHTVDIYSLGLVLYKLLNNNRLPFYPENGAYSDWDMQQALIDRLSGRKELPLPNSASPEFGKIITRMCAHNPKERYQKAEDVLADLEHITGSVKRVTGLSADASAPVSSPGADYLDVTRNIFESGMVIHDADDARKMNAGIAGNSSPKTPAAGSAEAGADGAAARAGREAEQTEPGRQDRSGESGPSNSKTQKKISRRKRKAIIQWLAVAAVVIAVLFYFLMNKRYSLTVTDGSGSGTYKGGQQVSVTADEIPGSVFTGWDSAGTLDLTNEEIASETVSFKMPRHKATLKAVYSADTSDMDEEPESESNKYENEDAYGDEYEDQDIQDQDIQDQNIQVQDIQVQDPPVAPTMVLNPDGTMTYDQHVYMVYDRNDFGIHSYAEMEEFCEKQGGHLAVISSAGENEAIYRYVVICGLTMAYFGYSDEDAEGIWEWATYEDNPYTNWASGQPNNGANNKNGEDEDYAHFSSDGDGTWNDAPFGSNTSHFVCEWD